MTDTIIDLSSTEITLTQQDPLLRLEELKSIASFKTEFTIVKLKNAFIVKCHLCLQNLDPGNYGGRMNMIPIWVETALVETEEMDEAKRTVAAILLDHLGLGVEETELEMTEEEEALQEATVQLGETMVGMGMQAISDLAHMPGTDPCLGEALSALEEGDSSNALHILLNQLSNQN